MSDNESEMHREIGRAMDRARLPAFEPGSIIRTSGHPKDVFPYAPESILQEAQRLVHGDRGAAYGHPIDDYKATGEIWGAILERAGWKGGPVDPRIACLMMVGVKVSREASKPKRDNRVDGAGYFECVDMIAERQAAGPQPGPVVEGT